MYVTELLIRMNWIYSKISYKLYITISPVNVLCNTHGMKTSSR